VDETAEMAFAQQLLRGLEFRVPAALVEGGEKDFFLRASLISFAMSAEVVHIGLSTTRFFPASSACEPDRSGPLGVEMTIRSRVGQPTGL